MKNDKVKTCSILVNGSRIDYIRSSMDNYHFIKMNMSPYIMAPGRVSIDRTPVEQLPFSQFKKHAEETYLKKGVTVIITVVKLSHERELKQKVGKRRKTYFNSPIDYYIAVQIPLSALTPSFVRACKKLNVSCIFLEHLDQYDWNNVPWGWISDAFSDTSIPLVPCFPESLSFIKLFMLKARWRKSLSSARISFLDEPLKEELTLAHEQLFKLGICPAKGEIRVGGDVDYNLFYVNESRILAGDGYRLYDRDTPIISVHKGKLQKAGEGVFFKPGFGEECYTGKAVKFHNKSAFV
ncbi:hypothetical protein ABES25_11120 [Bacillus gobiensis]|uniref:hypothetical protein n=1 Tax=Bacillus gobiensis TaxID=1441095 RepID=UPI003D1C4347